MTRFALALCLLLSALPCFAQSVGRAPLDYQLREHYGIPHRGEDCPQEQYPLWSALSEAHRTWYREGGDEKAVYRRVLRAKGVVLPEWLEDGKQTAQFERLVPVKIRTTQCGPGGCPPYGGGMFGGYGYQQPQPAPPASQSPSPSAPHHLSVGVVSVQGAAGSGTLVYSDGQTGIVITAAHVTDGQRNARVQWRNGTTSSGMVIGEESVGDIAAIQIAAPQGIPVVPVAADSEAPRQGSQVEMVGYGGMNFRHWYGRVSGYADSGDGSSHDIVVFTQTISGDSGGAIISNGKLVGVIWGGPTAGQGGPMLATQGACCVRIRRFLGRVFPRACQPQAPPSTEPGPIAGPDVVAPDYAAEIKELREKIAALESRKPERGPPGERGPAGPVVSIEVTDTGDVYLEGAKVANIRGPAGPQGPPGKDALPINPIDLAKQLPPIYVRVVDPSGKYTTEPAPVHLGGTMTLILDPTKVVGAE